MHGFKRLVGAILLAAIEYESIAGILLELSIMRVWKNTLSNKEIMIYIIGIDTVLIDCKEI